MSLFFPASALGLVCYEGYSLFSEENIRNLARASLLEVAKGFVSGLKWRCLPHNFPFFFMCYISIS